MATRNLIGVLEQGVVLYRYCHSGGSIEYNGQILLKHYNSLDKAKMLITLGDISSLYETIEQTLNSVYKDSPELPYTDKFGDFIKSARKDFGAEYLYLFDRKWYVNDVYKNNRFKELK